MENLWKLQNKMQFYLENPLLCALSVHSFNSMDLQLREAFKNSVKC